MAVAGGTAQRRWLRALLWLAGLLLAMFAVSCLFSSSADAAPPENPVDSLLDPVTHIVEPLLGKAEKPVAREPGADRAEKPVPHKKKSPAANPAPGFSPDEAEKPVTQVLKPVTDVVDPVVHQVKKPITQVVEPAAPLLGQTEKTLARAGEPVADLVKATAPLLHLVERPVANVLKPVKPLLDQVDHAVSTVVQPVAGVVQLLAPVLDLVEAPLSLVTGSVAVLSRGLGKAVEPVLVPLAEATESPLLPSPTKPKGSSVGTVRTIAKAPAVTAPAVSPQPSVAEAGSSVTVVRLGPALTTVTHDEQPTVIPAHPSAAQGTPEAPESPAPRELPPVPYVPFLSPGSATAVTPHVTPAGHAPVSVPLTTGYAVARQGDDVPLWRSIKPGSRPD
ncbi:hypothetical protein [Amycolatopsis sp. YIM 10]|uniref:hypothetical protein n=1 Tax=Amycolatopsis sp. YIM 10 TaxID=2653857 RepID=UPI0012905C24|nr:hypothetical protein [Amycolatopsis sp. YIM 10]QFU89244.1 hypothetical protein YIM_20325 [Amycolatopsis sp. YIM 10]